MSEVIDNKVYCKKCVLHSKIPFVAIDKEGHCQHCSAKKELNISNDNKELKSFLTKKMLSIFNAVQKKERTYDALVLFSGGKDSSYLINIMRNKYNLRILGFSLMHPLMTDAASKNIDEISEKLNVEIIKYHMDGEVYKDTIKKALLDGQNYGLTEFAPCDLCVFFVKWIAIRFAVKLNIPIVLDGMDGAQGGGIKDAIRFKKDNSSWYKPYGVHHDIIEDLLGKKSQKTMYGYDYKELESKVMPFYMSPLSFLEYDPSYSFKELEELGLTFKQFKSVNTNCEALYFLDYIAFKKYDCDTYVRQWAAGVRNSYNTLEQLELNNKENAKQLTRDQAISLLEEYKELIVSIVENKINLDVEEQNLSEILPVASSIFGIETIQAIIRMIKKIPVYASFFNIDINELEFEGVSNE